MHKNLLLALGAMLAVACNQSTAPNPAASTKGSETGGLVARGIVYGFTAAPDSQRVALEGVEVTLRRIGDLVPQGPGTGPDTTLVNRQGGIAFVADSVVPSEPPPPPPPPACEEGTLAATVTTGADGSWSARGLEQGIYRLRVTPKAGSHWQGTDYCGFVLSQATEGVDLYLIPAP